MLLLEVFGLYLGIKVYPITKSIFKRHFMPETFISIDNNLQRRVRLHNIDRLSHDSVLKPPFLYAKCNSLGFFHVSQCLYYPYSLPQHMTFSDLQPKLNLKYKLTLNLVTLSAACLFIHVKWSTERDQIDFLQYTDDVQVDRLPGVTWPNTWDFYGTVIITSFWTGSLGKQCRPISDCSPTEAVWSGSTPGLQKTDFLPVLTDF